MSVHDDATEARDVNQNSPRNMQPKSDEFLQSTSLEAPHRPGVQLSRHDVTLCWPHFLVLAKHSRSRSETAGQLRARLPERKVWTTRTGDTKWLKMCFR
ncbi:hypothetical protein SRHO_G00166880 [Serrasalmus rhombeus]